MTKLYCFECKTDVNIYNAFVYKDMPGNIILDACCYICNGVLKKMICSHYETMHKRKWKSEPSLILRTDDQNNI